MNARARENLAAARPDRQRFPAAPHGNSRHAAAFDDQPRSLGLEPDGSVAVDEVPVEPRSERVAEDQARTAAEAQAVDGVPRDEAVRMIARTEGLATLVADLRERPDAERRAA